MRACYAGRPQYRRSSRAAAEAVSRPHSAAGLWSSPRGRGRRSSAARRAMRRARAAGRRSAMRSRRAPAPAALTRPPSLPLRCTPSPIQLISPAVVESVGRGAPWRAGSPSTGRWVWREEPPSSTQAARWPGHRREGSTANEQPRIGPQGGTAPRAVGLRDGLFPLSPTSAACGRSPGAQQTTPASTPGGSRPPAQRDPPLAAQRGRYHRIRLRATDDRMQGCIDKDPEVDLPGPSAASTSATLGATGPPSASPPGARGQHCATSTSPLGLPRAPGDPLHPRSRSGRGTSPYKHRKHMCAKWLGRRAGSGMPGGAADGGKGPPQWGRPAAGGAVHCGVAQLRNGPRHPRAHGDALALRESQRGGARAVQASGRIASSRILWRKCFQERPARRAAALMLPPAWARASRKY